MSLRPTSSVRMKMMLGLPPAGASDDESHIQNCWTDGWIYKGLSTAVEFLKTKGLAGYTEEARRNAHGNGYLVRDLQKALNKMTGALTAGTEPTAKSEDEKDRK
jgi:hypothetical protein